MEAEEFRRFAHKLIDFTVDYHKTIRERPVLSDVRPGYVWDLLPESAPQDGENWEKIFEDIERVIMPGMTHWASPRFHAYFPTANSYPAICADILSGCLGIIGFTWASCPAATELEMVMMDWLGKMLNLPKEFLYSSGGKGGGVIQMTASETTLVALLAARTKAIGFLKQKNKEMKTTTVIGNLVAYCSDQSHSSVERAGLLADIEMKDLPTDENLSLRGDVLKKAIMEDRRNKKFPFYVVATLGTTNSCAFDNLLEIGKVCKEENIWLHVDAAYAGAAFICPEFQHYLNGIEYANSFNMNPHKWLLVNFDCSAMWVKNKYELTDAFNVNPTYLQHKDEGAIPDFRHWHIHLGRRFRSLKMWFVFRSYGIKGLQEFVRKHVQLAHKFEELLLKDGRFEIVTPVVMGLVCFRLKGSNSINENLLKTINDRRIIHLTPTKINGKYILRFAVCSRQTNEDDISFSWKEIQTVSTKLLSNV